MRSGSYTDDEVRQVTDMYFEGGVSHADVCKALGYPGHSTLSRWTRDDPRYLDHRIAQAAASVGGGGCAKSPRKSYYYEMKLEAVRLAEESRLTQREIAEALDLCAPAMVSKWAAIARKHGKEALMPKTRSTDTNVVGVGMAPT